MLQFDNTRCVGCGKCAWDCFPGAISMESGRPMLSAPGNCIGCGHCIAICPAGAVKDDALPMDDVIPRGAVPDPEALGTLLKTRRTCRHYRNTPVTEAELQMLLGAARACPTAKNIQGTRYIVVTEAIPALLDAALAGLGQVGQLQLQTAKDPGELRRAQNFISWAETRSTDKTFDPLFFHAPMLLLFISQKGDLRDAAGAAAYTELMAASLGLGCLYSGYFTACAAGSPEIQRMLNLGGTEQVARCLVLGHPDVRYPRSAPRRALDVQYL